VAESIRSEDERRVDELRALIRGQAAELGRLEHELDECERRVIKLVSGITRLRGRIARLEARLKAAGLPTNGELED
jgi:predicted  nucleic acid-binding Zn-ribbon protein